jgi:hypothetical protein
MHDARAYIRSAKAGMREPIRKTDGHQKFVTGFRPIVRARQGLMLGIRQPLDGPVFQKLQDAEHWCIHAMVCHYDRRLGTSDGRIEPFKGLANCFTEPPPSLLKDVDRICKDVERQRSAGSPE